MSAVFTDRDLVAYRAVFLSQGAGVRGFSQRRLTLSDIDRAIHSSRPLVESARGTRDVNEARTPFPTTPTLLKFTGSRVFGMAALALGAMATIDLQRHKNSCTGSITAARWKG
jgi:hypothetical protein